jgi:hypothetical protein
MRLSVYSVFLLGSLSSHALGYEYKPYKPPMANDFNYLDISSQSLRWDTTDNDGCLVFEDHFDNLNFKNWEVMISYSFYYHYLKQKHFFNIIGVDSK